MDDLPVIHLSVLYGLSGPGERRKVRGRKYLALRFCCVEGNSCAVKYMFVNIIQGPVVHLIEKRF